MSNKDYELWQSHVLLSDTVQPLWEGAEDLQEKAIVLVAENQMAGRVNGQRLRARAQDLLEASKRMGTDKEAELIEFIIDNKHRLREISLRMVLKIADLWKMAPDKYKLLAENTCMKPERELQ